MQRLSLDQAQPSFVLAKPAVDDRGRTLIAEENQLTSAHIEQLKRRNVGSVTVMGAPAAVDDGMKRMTVEERVVHLAKAFARHRDNPFMMRLRQTFMDQIKRKVARERKQAQAEEAALNPGRDDKEAASSDAV